MLMAAGFSNTFTIMCGFVGLSVAIATFSLRLETGYASIRIVGNWGLIEINCYLSDSKTSFLSLSVTFWLAFGGEICNLLDLNLLDAAIVLPFSAQL